MNFKFVLKRAFRKQKLAPRMADRSRRRGASGGARRSVN
jgi:hypothetical protein